MESRKKSFEKALEKVELHSQETAIKRKIESRRDKIVLENEQTRLESVRQKAQKEARELSDFNLKHNTIFYTLGFIALTIFLYNVELSQNDRTDMLFDAVLWLGYLSMMYGKYKSKK